MIEGPAKAGPFSMTNDLMSCEFVKKSYTAQNFQILTGALGKAGLLSAKR